MDKREFELSKLTQTTKRIESIVASVRLVIICLTVLYAIHLVLEGIQPLIGQEADEIHAFAALIEKFNFGSFFGYLLSVVFGAAWCVERQGKLRAIKEKARYQGIAEENEPNRSSSGLTPTGQSPVTS